MGDGPEGSSTLSRRLKLKWTATLRQPRGAGSEGGGRGRESIPVPVRPRLWLRSCSRNGARPLAAPRTARGRPAHRTGALARRTAKQAPARPGPPPLARYRARKRWLKCSRGLGRQVALSRGCAVSRGLALAAGGAGAEAAALGARGPSVIPGLRCVRSARSSPGSARAASQSLQDVLSPVPRPCHGLLLSSKLKWIRLWIG